MAAPPATRTVVRYSRNGPSSVLEVVTDAPVPPRGAGQVLIDNKAAALNPVDYKLRAGFGLLSKVVGPKLPAIPGGDIAGVVLESDAGSSFKPGDRVMGLMGGLKFGGYASTVVVPTSALSPVPAALTFEQAAAIPLAALTAWQSLDLARAKAGDRVLVHAGAGGVGSFGIQLAKARGCHVATTCSAKNVDFVKGLGADEVCDYTAEAFEEKWAGAPFDVVLDTIVLHGYEARSLKVTKKRGAYVSLIPGPAVVKGLLRSALRLGPRYRVVWVVPSGDQLAQIGRLVEEGKVKVEVARTLPLSQAAEAQDELAKGHTRGKIVLTI